MSCPTLEYSVTSNPVGLAGLTISVVVPEVYTCTNIQIRFNYDGGGVDEWFDYSVLTSTTTTLNLTIPDTVCSVDLRLSQCCGGSVGDDPPPLPDDPPCTTIATSEADCSSSKVSITNPYRRPADSSSSLPAYNDIFIPKRVNLTITQNSCNDIEALLCSVRCPDIATSTGGQCPCIFTPYVDINTLQTIDIGRTPFGVPIDYDKLCNSSNYKGRPQFNSPNYTKVEAYCRNLYGATPFIDGIGYTSSLNINTYIKVHTAPNADAMRSWLTEHFRFFTLDNNQIIFTWPYTDLYWTPYDFAIPNNKFTPETGTIYVELVPC